MLLLVVSFGCLWVFLVLYTSSKFRWSSLLFVAIGVFFIVKDVLCSLKGADVELLVTNLDFKSAGHAPEGYSPSIISRADINRLEFRKASGGVDGPDLPQGHYVEHRGDGLWNPGTCVLPQIDQTQTEEVINAIYSRFPETGTLSPADPSGLILLNLSKSDPKSRQQ